MDNLADIDMALGLYYAAGVSITPGDWIATIIIIYSTMYIIANQPTAYHSTVIPFAECKP